ncbi:hypothetical protein SAMN02745119_03361 [Trichlorobacter thiogenes]|uniref:Uncharacterized protein n=1 Tax=Trichlorobacter thiogenes TaxID=115783 RepID=A0A1T4S9S5_9BACT|nr:hypothetical protein [Trichlorobacter thiogenes]SKA25060.1 hypothetical protein SAMN02745119_03361 [Trichlorobacter thiogenes]
MRFLIFVFLLIASHSWALSTSLNIPTITVSTSGDAFWIAQDVYSHDGAQSAESGLIQDMQRSTIEFYIIGPVQVGYWWKVSSEYAWDRLNFYIDGVFQKSISGEVDWNQQIVNIPPGEHKLSWSYEKDNNLSFGLDRAWLDEITFSFSSDVSRISIAGNLFPSFAVAYTLAAPDSIMLLNDVDLQEDVTTTKDQTITLQGGYDRSFASRSEVNSIIQGVVTIEQGTIIFDGVTIR